MFPVAFPLTVAITSVPFCVKVIEGFANPDNLLYGPEIKFYSNKVVIDNNFESSVKGLYCIGDGSGMTRGLMMASCSGVQMARILNNK